MTTIIIPVYRGLLIKEVLLSIAAQKKAVISEIILVLNKVLIPKKADFLKITNEFKNVKVVDIELNNVSVARNKGLSYSKTEFTLFLDEDCLLSDPHCLEKMLQKQNTNCGVGTLFVLKGRPFKEQFYNFKINLWMQCHAEVLLAGGVSLYKTEVIKNLEFNREIDYGGSETSLQDQIYSKNLGSFDLVIEKMVIHQVKEKWKDLFLKSKKQSLRSRTFNSIPKLQYGKLIECFRREKDLSLGQKARILAVLGFERFWNLF